MGRLSLRLYWSDPHTRADVLAAGKGGVRGSWLFDAAPANRRSVRANTLSTSPISKLRAADDERRQAKHDSLADKLTVEAKALADLKVEKAAVEGERRKVEADLGTVRYLATLLGTADEVVLRWFILVVALLLDPAAVPLLLAATRTRS
jgi:hypothetical protein